MIKSNHLGIVQDKNLRGNSSTWANWMSVLELTTCLYCTLQHGKIFDISILKGKNEAQAHPHCKCIYVPMRAKLVGTATDQGMNGTDVYLAYYKKLPDYYVSKEEAENAGWVSWLGNLNQVLPGKMIGGGIFKNNNGKLPMVPGRKWYEVDINYKEGRRSEFRIVFSNDGLLFITHDHYKTFYEIIA